jgi:hypothetical protein
MAPSIHDNMFLGRSKPAWHRAGMVFPQDEQVSAEQGVVKIGAERIVIEPRRMGYQTPDGTFTPVNDRVVLVRLGYNDKEPVAVGEAGSDYTVLQNIDLARTIDTAGLSQRWTLDTVGVLGRGETIFLCFLLGTDKIAGEDHRKYALFTDTRDGRTALQVMTCWTRVVCWNTLQVALAEGQDSIKVSLEHTPEIGSNFRFSLDIIDQVEAQATRTKEALLALRQIGVPRSAVSTIWERTYPYPRRGQLLRQYDQIDDPARFDGATLKRLEQMATQWDYRRSMVDPLRVSAQEQYDTLCRDYPHMRDNGLGILNAVAAVADHTRNRGGGMAAITGNRAAEKIRAYRSIMDYAGLDAALSVLDAEPAGV